MRLVRPNSMRSEAAMKAWTELLPGSASITCQNGSSKKLSKGGGLLRRHPYLWAKFQTRLRREGRVATTSQEDSGVTLPLFKSGWRQVVFPMEGEVMKVYALSKEKIFTVTLSACPWSCRPWRESNGWSRGILLSSYPLNPCQSPLSSPAGPFQGSS